MNQMGANHYQTPCLPTPPVYKAPCNQAPAYQTPCNQPAVYQAPCNQPAVYQAPCSQPPVYKPPCGQPLRANPPGPVFLPTIYRFFFLANWKAYLCINNFEKLYFFLLKRSRQRKSSGYDKYRSIYNEPEFDIYSDMNRCLGPASTDYDKLSAELWADYFYDLKLQNLRQNEYDYGFSKDFIQQERHRRQPQHHHLDRE